MLILFTSPSCMSSRKAKAWLEEHGVTFKEKNLYRERLSIEEIKEMVRMTIDGVDEIIAKRSKVYQTLEVDFETLTMKKLYSIICENPKILRSPILLDKKRLLVGFDSEQIRCFLPRKVKALYLEKLDQINQY